MPEACCLECHRRITISSATGIEYGHATGWETSQEERCSRRPTCVDPAARDIPPSYAPSQSRPRDADRDRTRNRVEGSGTGGEA